MRPIATLALAVLLAGCGGTAADPEPSPRASADVPTPPVLASPSASTEPLVGTLGGDAQLEGGCVWLNTDEGRIEVLWPEGWTVGTDPIELRDPGGEVVAGEGDRVRVDAAPAPALVSTCQIGELWRATTVDVP